MAMHQGELFFHTFLFMSTFLFVQKVLRSGARAPNLPPGPETRPVVGNSDIASGDAVHLKYTWWARMYGHIFSLKHGEHTTIVLNNIDSANELINKRSESFVEASPEDWKLHRETAEALLSSSNIMDHRAVQQAEGFQLLQEMIDSPQEFVNHINRASTSTLASMFFGRRLPRFESTESDEFHEINRLNAHLASSPPSHEKETELAKKRNKFYNHLVASGAKRASNKQGWSGSFAEEVLRRKDSGITRDLVPSFLGSLLESGSPTLSVFLQNLILALASNPDVQRKAQNEIERNIGYQRAPQSDDIASLPFVKAVVKETFRFRPSVPVGASLRTAVDGEFYRGYALPKGSTVVPNIYGMTHDPEYFDDAESFKPERFLQSEFGTKQGVDDNAFRQSATGANVMFGAGDQAWADLSSDLATLNATNLIWAFNFTLPKDSEGQIQFLDMHTYDYSKSTQAPSPKLTSTQLQSISIAPRNRKVRNIVEQEFVEATRVFERFEQGIPLEDRKFIEGQRAKMNPDFEHIEA
ncbi:hypothetical protein AAF712_013526 [Marasmius tenuissimus]|uniref:Cytochrome P450 n=1 Tax=Marasmius tenuissimus TaxID=585030 RepID=A0ABR2ZDH3_9AGAR